MLHLQSPPTVPPLGYLSLAAFATLPRSPTYRTCSESDTARPPPYVCQQCRTCQGVCCSGSLCTAWYLQTRQSIVNAHASLPLSGHCEPSLGKAFVYGGGRSSNVTAPDDCCQVREATLGLGLNAHVVSAVHSTRHAKLKYLTRAVERGYDVPKKVAIDWGPKNTTKRHARALAQTLDS